MGQTKPRARDLGVPFDGTPAPLNAVTDIAGLLHISPKTVDTYRSNIMRKLAINDIVGLVKFAIQRNLTSTNRAP